MEKETRNAIERATQRARKLIEEDFSAQLEGDFDVHPSGAVAAKAGSHLSARQAFQRDRIVAAIEHKRAAGMAAAEAVADYLRDAAFTALNRFVALKMLEARELVQECITKGEQSSGYREFWGMAPGLSLLPDSAGYRLYVESLFDELSTEVKVLFDRRDPSSVLWPKRTTFEQLLDILNASELAGVWGEDETIGWVYQFFNGADERRKMREEGQAPRNSRELAVRNQFFTPRYVVRFLIDNTLGRIWYEMRGTKTALTDRCQYMVRKPGGFAPRAKKDPRELRVLDPACGSGHFLLYAFDLLLTIYEEAYTDPESPRSQGTGTTLREDYPSVDALRRAAPCLILAHNLHGVDIDARCAQIAQLALWMRAQRAYGDLGVARAERPLVRRSNIVLAEPLVADDETLDEFLGQVRDPELGRAFKDLVDTLKLAGDLGVLLRLEFLLTRKTRPGEVGDLFAPAEARIRAALANFIAAPNTAARMRRRLFLDDAAQGVGLLEIAEKKFDVVVMNPPFGKPSIGGKEYIDQRYDRGKSDIYAAFVERGVELAAHGGSIGALTSRLGLFSAFLEGWRSEFMFGDGSLVVLADLGHGVLDDALVEAAAYVLEKGTGSEVFWGRGLLESRDKSTDLLRMTRASGSDGLSWRNRARLRSLPGSPIAYWVPDSFIAATFAHPPLAESVGEARWGLQADDNFRFVRLAWEVVPDGKSWFPLAKGGEYALFYDDIHLAVRWSDSARELRAFIEAKYSWTKRASSAELYGRPGLTYPERTTSELSLRALPAGCIFNIAGPAIVIEDCTLRLSLLALSYTRVFRTLVEVLIGGGDAVESGSAARHYKAGALNRVPVPLLANAEGRKLAQAGKTSLDIALELAQQDETGRLFAGLSLRKSFDDFLTTTIFQYEDALITLEQQSQEADDLAMDSYGLDNESRRFVDQAYGPHSSRGQAVPRQERVARLLDLSEDALVDELAPQLGYRRQTTKQAYFTDRKYELVALAENASVASVVRSRRALGFASNEQRDRWAHAVLSWLFGVGIGRWHGRPRRWTGDPFEALPLAPPALRDEVGRVRDVVVDDPGTASDIEAVISAACAEVGWESTQVVAVATVAAGTDTRGYFANEFFGQHITRYSRSRRKAPIYWQLATPSARYSVWLYLNALTKDTLYKVQSEYVAPKLAHEERRLESLRLELGERPKSSDRRALASQESFVDELHAFLDEVKRVAPLWKPNPDDGVIINFAPLWRLVPQHRQWQQELKATWDALCDGEHDWVHLAMHLWPERVLPKCATDRSLAIAHGVEQIFWVESTEGKWTSRKSPTRSIEELVRERASPAVKAALKSLLEAPVATGSRGRGRGGRRLPDVPAEEGAP